jgi:hypothetical protein
MAHKDKALERMQGRIKAIADKETLEALELAQLVQNVTDAKRKLVEDLNASHHAGNELHLFDAINKLGAFYKAA